MYVADFHYWPKNHVGNIPQLEEIEEAANTARVDAMVYCGDLCHNMTTVLKLVDVYFSTGTASRSRTALVTMSKRSGGLH